MARKMGTAGINHLKDFEGCNLNVYADIAGYPTVGYGHKLSETKYTPNKNLSQAAANKELKNAGLSYTSPITKAQVETLLKQDLARFEKAVNNLTNSSKLTQTQFDSLVSYSFNYGEGIFGTGDMKTLLKCPETYSDYVGAIRVSFSQDVTNAFNVITSGGVRAEGLVVRRNAEASLFCKGMRYWYNEIK